MNYPNGASSQNNVSNPSAGLISNPAAARPPSIVSAHGTLHDVCKWAADLSGRLHAIAGKLDGGPTSTPPIAEGPKSITAGMVGATHETLHELRDHLGSVEGAIERISVSLG